jgi:hypothetical protein
MIERVKRTGAWSYGLGAAILLGIGIWIGHVRESTPLAAQQKNPSPAVATNNTPATDASKRVVAYIHGTIPVTREEFGNYLINLYGKDRIDLFVNKKIIEMECAKHNPVVDVTDQEIDALILEDCGRIKISKDDYIRNVLKRYNKSLAEWRNDVMKPRLLLAKLCRDRIPVDEDDLKKMFENRYGEKVRCKIILWPKEQLKIAENYYATLRKDDAGFDSVASKQPNSVLAAHAGEIDPIGRYSGPDSAKVEEYAFNLKVGEVTPIIKLEIGCLVIKRIGTIPPAKNVAFEKVRAQLRKEVIDRKVEKEIPIYFKALRDDANPVFLMENAASSRPTVLRNPTEK